MKRRVLLLACAAMLVSSAVRGQQTAKAARVGFLAMGDRNDWRLRAFTEGLREFGYIEGQNVVIEARFAELGRYEQFDAHAADLVRRKVDVIAASLNPEIA